MTLITKPGVPIDARLVSRYLSNLVNLLYKILPLREKGETSIVSYMESLQIELLGAKELIEALEFDRMYLTIINIVTYLISHSDEPVAVYKREVFKAISLCNKMKTNYGAEEDR